MNNVPAKKGQFVLIEIRRSVTMLNGRTDVTKAYVFGVVNSTDLHGKIKSWYAVRTGSVTRGTPQNSWLIPTKTIDEKEFKRAVNLMDFTAEFESFQAAKEFAAKFKIPA